MQKDGRQIVFIISDMRSGGAQKVVTTIANRLATTGKNITLITFSDKKNDFFKLNENITRITLGIYGQSNSFACAIYNNYMRLVSIRRAIKYLSPHTVISFIGVTNILTIVASLFLKTRVIISERSDPSIEKLGFPWQFLRVVLYRYADLITANSHGAIDKMRKYVPTNKLCYLPNPIDLTIGNLHGYNPERGKYILAVGNLRQEKGYDILLKAFAAVSNKLPEWKLIIVGDGILSGVLKEQAAYMRIEDKIIWEGRVDDPAQHYAKSAIFVLPSRREGMPNALLEAMSYKLAAIVTNSSPGPLEIVINSQTGLVVDSENHAALSQALILLAKDESLRIKLGNAAADKVSEFHLDKVLPVWESVIKV